MQTDCLSDGVDKDGIGNGDWDNIGKIEVEEVCTA
jgi:hypothetical protein